MRRAARTAPAKPLPPLRAKLPSGRDVYTCLTDEETRRTWTPRSLYPEVMADAAWSVEFDRPRTTAECPPGDYCPFVSCQFHLYLDVNQETGTLILNHPHMNVWDLEECCVLKALAKKDLEHEDGYTLEEVGRFMGLTRERVRQIEQEIREKVRAAKEHGRLDGYFDLYAIDED